MIERLMSAIALVLCFATATAQERFTVVKDLRSAWMSHDDGMYEYVETIPLTGLRTIYFQFRPDDHPRQYLRVSSGRSYFLFVNGQVRGEFNGVSVFRIDSLLTSGERPGWVAIHQQRINERDLTTEIISMGTVARPVLSHAIPRPYNSFRDFVVIAGLIVIVLFVGAFHLNPKLASDYFAVNRILASRESEDSQSSVRLTGGSNVQFYVLCSLMIGYYLFIIIQHLPVHYQLPVRFYTTAFGTMWWQWLKLSGLVFFFLVGKVLIIYSLTRLFDMRGVARFHFFNWIRLLLVVLGAATIILFMYFITRGDDPVYYIGFLFVIVAVLLGWILVAFFKLSAGPRRSMFHLFSYLCATEIIPLLITVKVLFQ